MMLTAYLLGAFAFIGGIGLTISSAWLITMASMHPPILTLTVAITLVRFFGIFRSVARYFERLVSHKAVFSRLTDLRVEIYKTLSHSSISVARRFNNTRAVKSIVDDVERAQEYQLRIKLPHSSAFISLTFGVVLAYWVAPESIFLTLPSIILLLFITPFLIKRRSEPLARGIEKNENGYSQIVEASIHGATEAAIYGYKEENYWRANLIEKDLVVAEADLLKASWRFSTLTNLVIAICILAFTVLALFLSESQIMPAVQITMLIFIPLVIFEAITSWYPNLFTAGKLLMSQNSVDELMAIKTDKKLESFTKAKIANVTAQDITVAWDRQFMAPVSFSVESGQLLVIRGGNGSGKSTLAMGILGLLPYEGSLKFDGLEARGFDGFAGHIVGTVQRSHIFNTTIRENLKIANQNASDEQISAILNLVELNQLLAELSDGLDTVIGDFGRTISGGEAKRLALARALLADADLYIFDEPTEHLDQELAARIEAAVMALLKEKIVIVITHSGWENCDKTLTMER